MRRWLIRGLLAAAAGAAGCGGDDDARMRLTTPPERPGAEPLPEIRRAEKRAARDAAARPTRADVRRLRPVIDGWARAVRRNQYERAAAFFTVPVIIAQGAAMRLETAAQVRAFNVALPCGARLLRLTTDGRYLVGTFRLTRRPEHTCADTGEVVRVAFVLRGRKIAEWRRVPDVPGAEPGPERPEGAPPPAPEQVS